MLGMLEEPVCGMEVNLAAAPATSEYRGEIYYFCSTGCRDAFEKNPEEYLFPDEENRSE